MTSPPPVVTLTAALADAFPPMPVQLTEYVEFAVGGAETEPEFALPVGKPVPAQEVALVNDQVTVAHWPDVTEDGEVAVGEGYSLSRQLMNDSS